MFNSLILLHVRICSRLFKLWHFHVRVRKAWMMCVWACASVATRRTLLAQRVQTAEHLKSSGWLPALMGLTSMTTGGLLSVNQRWEGESSAQAIRNKQKERKCWRKEQMRKGQREGMRCNEGNELPGQKQEGHLKLFNSGLSRWNFSLCSNHTASLSFYIFLFSTLLPNPLHRFT